MQTNYVISITINILIYNLNILLIVLYMLIEFIPRGRLGNAIFRYFACSLFCIKYNYTYKLSIKSNEKQFTEKDFIKWMKNNYNPHKSLSLNHFYQHDIILIKNIEDILNFINLHPEHRIETDRNESYYIKDVITTPPNFSKIYNTVIHIRLEDFVKYNLVIPCSKIIELFESIDTLNESCCIVCAQLTTNYEKDYIKQISDYIIKKFNIKTILESNDVITDLNIMKMATTLICSTSTLSWSAALLSSTISTCYFPNYIKKRDHESTFIKPIDNTILYDI
uniref:Uncharacterized protein n=1 Tax=viral metagenome TaxID=1070528 RepID=A0A6C0J7F2_9ZZZZ